jgi:hypothetical protein
VPAPAVIPAPKAYINAVAVKGFVVELRAAKSDRQVPSASGCATVVLAAREHQKQETRERFLSQISHAMHAGGRP